MDRDKRWERVKKCYDAIVNGEGNKSGSAIKAIEDSYQKEVFDEFVEPTLICNGNEPIAIYTYNNIDRKLIDDNIVVFEIYNGIV